MIIINKTIFKTYDYEDDHKFFDDIFYVDESGCEYCRIGQVPKKYIINDTKLNQIRIKTLTGKGDTKLEETVGSFSVDKIETFKSYFGEDDRYLFHIRTRHRGKFTIGPDPLTQIVAKFRSLAVIQAPRMTSEIVNRCVDMKDQMGDLQISKRPAYPGFFYNKTFDSVDINNLPLPSMPSVVDVEHALIILETFVNEFGDFKDNFGYVLHWGCYAPFSFAKKQIGINGFQPGLLLFGDSQAGKSTTATTLCHMWGLRQQDHLLSGSDVNTEYNLAQSGQEDTFPRVVDEGEDLYSKPELLNMIKNIPQKIHSRTRMNANGVRESSVALSNILITSNRARPDEGALTVRIGTLEYFGDIRPVEEVDDFNRTYEPQNEYGMLSALRDLGDCFVLYMTQDIGLLKMKWTEAAAEMWRRVYEYAGRDMPLWLENPGRTDDIQGTVAIQKDIEAEACIGTLLKSWNPSINGHKQVSPSEQLGLIADLGLEPWLHSIKVTKGINKGEYYIVTKGFERALKRYTGMSLNLEVIAKALNGTYNHRTRLNGRRKPAIKWNKEELHELLDVHKNALSSKNSIW